jgi:hypothetical protein
VTRKFFLLNAQLSFDRLRGYELTVWLPGDPD